MVHRSNLVIYAGPIYEVVQEKPYNGEDEDILIDKILNIKFPIPMLVDYL